MANPWFDPRGWADEWNDAIEAAKAEAGGTVEGLDAALKKHCAPLIVADLNYELPLMRLLRERRERRRGRK